jgi:hypothetical protein
MTDGERRWLIVLVAAYLGATVAFYCTADHLPPRAAGMTRASSPSAMARNDSQPTDCEAGRCRRATTSLRYHPAATPSRHRRQGRRSHLQAKVRRASRWNLRGSGRSPPSSPDARLPGRHSAWRGVTGRRKAPTPSPFSRPARQAFLSMLFHNQYARRVPFT